MANRRVEAPSLPEFPELGDTPESVKAYLRAISREVLQGRLDHVVGRELNQICKNYLQVLKHEHDVSEFEQLRELVRRAEATANRGLAQEVADRQHTKLLAAPNGSKQKADS